MNSDDCILDLNIKYKEKSFNINSENIITINEIKEEIIKHFKLNEEDKNYIKLFLKNGEKDIFIDSENDIINNADDTDINHPKLNINLLIEQNEKSCSSSNNLIPQNFKTIDPDINDENDVKSFNEGINTVTKESLDKFEELRKIINNLTNEIKILKEEQFNQNKIIEENKLKMKNEFEEYKKHISAINNKRFNEENKKLEELIQIEYNKIIEENQQAYKKTEDFFQYKNTEIKEFQNQIQESLGKNMLEMKDSFTNKIIDENNKYKQIIEELKEKIDKLEQNNIENIILKIEDKINEQKLNIYSDIKNYIEQKFQKLLLDSIKHEKEIESLKKCNQDFVEFKSLLESQLEELLAKSKIKNNQKNKNDSQNYNIINSNSIHNIIGIDEIALNNSNNNINNNETNNINTNNIELNGNNISNNNINNKMEQFKQQICSINKKEKNLNFEHDVDEKKKDNLKKFQFLREHVDENISNEKIIEILDKHDGDEKQALIELSINKTML